MAMKIVDLPKKKSIVMLVYQRIIYYLVYHIDLFFRWAYIPSIRNIGVVEYIYINAIDGNMLK
jgi:hypothetical protein